MEEIKTPKILVVDDSTTIIKMVKMIVNKMKIEIESETDPMVGLETLKNNKYDVLILDIEMPKINGIQFLQEMKNAGLKIPVIILTGKYENNITLISQVMKKFPNVISYEVKSVPYATLENNLTKNINKVLHPPEDLDKY